MNELKRSMALTHRVNAKAFITRAFKLGKENRQ